MPDFATLWPSLADSASVDSGSAWPSLAFTDDEAERVRQKEQRAADLKKRIDTDPWSVMKDKTALPGDKLTAAMAIQEDRSKTETLDRLYYPKKFPVVGGFLRAAEAVDAKGSIDRIQAGKGTDFDYWQAARFLKMQEDQGDYNTVQRLFDGVLESGSFIGDVLATGGISGAAKGAAKKATTELAEKALTRGASKIVGRGAGVGAQVAAQTALMPGRIAGDAGQRYAAGDDPMSAIAKGAASTAVDVGTEQLGSAFTKYLPKALRKKLWINPRGIAGRAGIHNLPSEMFEESASDIAKGATGLSPDYGATGQAMQGNFQPLAETAGVVGLTGGAAAIPQLAGGSQKPLRFDTTQKLPTAAEVNEAMSRPETAQAWATANPEAATRMAAIDSPSRKEWEELTGEKMRGNHASRKAFADNVREAIRQPGMTTDRQMSGGFPAENAGSGEVTRQPADNRRDPRWHYGNTPWKPEPSPESIADTVGTTPIANDPTPGQTSDTSPFAVGDAVQWTVNGADQFPEPRKVTNLSPDGKYAFVEGATTGVPVEQLSKQQPVEQVTEFSTPVADYRLKQADTAPVAMAPETPPVASEPAPASVLPPDLQNATDDELAGILKSLGGKPPAKFPKNTYRSRLEADVAGLFKQPPGKVTFPPNKPEANPQDSQPIQWRDDNSGFTYGKLRGREVTVKQANPFAASSGEGQKWRVLVDSEEYGPDFASHAEAKAHADKLLRHQLMPADHPAKLLDDLSYLKPGRNDFPAIKAKLVAAGVPEGAVDAMYSQDAGVDQQEVEYMVEKYLSTDDQSAWARENLTRWARRALPGSLSNGNLLDRISEVTLKHPEAWDYAWEKLQEIKREMHGSHADNQHDELLRDLMQELEAWADNDLNATDGKLWRSHEYSPMGQPNKPEQRAPVATVTPESANALNQPVSDKTPQPAPRNPAQEAVVSEERRAAVLAAFRGQATKAVELPAAENHRGGYRVEFANGQFVDVLHKDTIPGDREGIRRSLVGQLGREPTEEEIATHGPSAAFVVRDDEGRELPGLGAMHIALDTPSATAYRHEALHMARRNNQISVAEWRLLKDKYAPGLNDAEAEERIANSAEAWSDPTIGDRVRAFFHKLLEALGMLDAKTVEALIKTGEVFNRKGNRAAGPKAKPARTTAAPEALAASPEPVTGAMGRSTTITAGEKKYPAQYRVLDLEQITPSHDFWRGTPKDNVEDGKFPAGLQPRDYNDPNEKMKVRERSNAEESHYFLEDTQRADGGPPTVSKDGIVFNGNGRAMMLQMAAGEGRYDWYKNALKEKAAQFGIDPAEVASRKHPVLVRVVDVDPNSKAGAEFAAAGNTTATMSQSSLRTASSLAKLIDADLLDSVPTGEEASFSDIVAGGATGKDFRAMIYKAIPPGERPRYFNTDQTLTSDGKELVRNMLLTRILPVDVVEKLNVDRKQMGNAIEKALPVLLKLSSKPVLFKQFSKAVGYLADHPDARTKATLDDVFRQRGFLDDDRLTSREKMFAEFVLLKSSTPNKFRDALRQMMADLRAGRGLLAEASADTGVLMADALGVEHRKGDASAPTFQVRAYHGSPRSKHFDKFSTQYMGTGEGAQAYGWGMYFAGKKEVADWYRARLSRGTEGKGTGYVVNLKPDEDEYLLWDKPLSEQSEKVKSALRRNIIPGDIPSNLRDAISRAVHNEQTAYDRDWNPSDGQSLYRALAQQRGIPESSADRWASEYLKSIGIRGIKYLEGQSRIAPPGQLKYEAKWAADGEHVDVVERASGNIVQTFQSFTEADKWMADNAHDEDRSYNYVIFDDDDVEITEKYQVRGRPDLANPGTTKPVRKLVDDVDEARNQAGEPQRRSDKEVHEAVAQRLRKDYAGEKKRLLAFVKGSDLVTDEDVLIAKEIINREGVAGIASGNVKEAIALIDAYRRQGAEQGRAFRQRRDPIETPDQRVRRNLIEAVLTPPKKKQRQIDEAMKDGNTAKAEKVRGEWEKEFAEIKRKLKLLGVDLDNLNEYGYDPIRAAKAIGVVRAQKADAWDKAYEYWRNAILSGPKTQVANVIGTVGNAGWKFMVERPIEAAINSFVGRPEGAQIGEFQHLAAGILPGLSRAARNAMTSFQTEVPELERQLDRDGQFRIEEADVAIGGKLGRGVRMPQRLMLAADEFLKSFVATMDVGAQAYRIAKAEKLSGDAMRRRIEYLVNDLQSHAWTDAHDTALELSFQQKGSPTAKKLKEGLLKFRRIPGLRYVFPFVTTPVNIFEQGLRKAPITGDIGALKALYDNYKSERPLLTNMTPRMADRVVAWGLTLALMSLIGGDDDEPFITGTVTTKDRGARDLSRRTYPPQSIRIGNRWFSYSRIEPFATTLALTVDWLNGLKSGDAEKIATTPFRSIFQQMKDKTFLDGVGDLMRIVDAPNTADEVANYGSSFVVSWVPNLVRATSRETGDQYQERSVWGSGSERRSRLLRRTIQRTELGLMEDRPAIDLWGREAKRGTSPVMGTDIPWRILSPADSRVPDLFVGDKVLLRWNAQNPGDEHYPAMPTKKIGDRDMTDEEYEQFLRISGGAARKMVERLRLNTEKPTKDDIAALEEAIDAARTRTRAAMKEGTPVTVDAVAGSMFDKEVQQRADIIVRSPPLKVADRDKWRQEKAEALQWLKDKGLTKDDVLKIYSPKFRSLKDAKERGKKHDRLSDALGGL